MTRREPDACSAPYRVRYDEAGPDGLIRTSVLLRYTQDLASFHSTARGFGREWYRERGLVWLVRAGEVAVLAPIADGDELVGTTQVAGWRRVWARRRTEFHDGAGTLVAWVHIDWVLLDAAFRPTRIPPEFDGVFGTAEGAVTLGRVDLGEVPADAAARRILVRPRDLDPMDHANNAVYADWVDEAVIGGGDVASTRAIPRVLRLEYAQSAEPDATVDATSWSTAEGWAIRLSAADGTDLLRARLGPG